MWLSPSCCIRASPFSRYLSVGRGAGKCKRCSHRVWDRWPDLDFYGVGVVAVGSMELPVMLPVGCRDAGLEAQRRAINCQVCQDRGIVCIGAAFPDHIFRYCASSLRNENLAFGVGNCGGAGLIRTPQSFYQVALTRGRRESARRFSVDALALKRDCNRSRHPAFSRQTSDPACSKSILSNCCNWKPICYYETPDAPH